MAGKNQHQIKVGAARTAKPDGTSMSQLVATTADEKVSALETMDFFDKRARRADLTSLDRLLSRAGGETPRAGDEVPEGYKRRG